MARIQLENVGLTFHLRRQGRFSFKELLVGGMARRMREPGVVVQALQNVSLEISEGERVGIIGHNGAGKSTLLKLLAGVYAPSTGERRVEGRISSLFDISLGFEMHATGAKTSPIAAIYKARRRKRCVRARADRRVQRVGQPSRHAGAVLFFGHAGAVGLLDRHGH